MPALVFAQFEKGKKTHENWEFLFEIMESSRRTFISRVEQFSWDINNPDANYISCADLSMKISNSRAFT
jgi:hypothetical protein